MRLCDVNVLSAQMACYAGPGSYVDGKRPHAARAGFRLPIMLHGRRVDVGLGNARLVSIADARRAAAGTRAVACTGGDPRKGQDDLVRGS